MFRIVHTCRNGVCKAFIQRGDIGKIDLSTTWLFSQWVKWKLVEGHFAVREMTTHQQMVTEVGLRPVRRPEVAHHIIRRILAA